MEVAPQVLPSSVGAHGQLILLHQHGIVSMAFTLIFLTCRETTTYCQNIEVHQSSEELLQTFLKLAAKWGSLCSIESTMTPSGHSAARSSVGFPFIPAWLKEVQAKSTLSTLIRKLLTLFSSLQLMIAGGGICWHLHFTESCEKRKRVPQRFQGEQEVWCNLVSGFYSRGPQAA